MSRQSKLAKRAKLSKQTKGDMKGKDASEKSPVPHQQPSAVWMTPKKKTRGTPKERG